MQLALVPIAAYEYTGMSNFLKFLSIIAVSVLDARLPIDCLFVYFVVYFCVYFCRHIQFYPPKGNNLVNCEINCYEFIGHDATRVNIQLFPVLNPVVAVLRDRLLLLSLLVERFDLILINEYLIKVIN